MEKSAKHIEISVLNRGVNMAAKLPPPRRGNKDENLPFLCCICGKQFLRIAVRFTADKLEIHLVVC